MNDQEKLRRAKIWAQHLNEGRVVIPTDAVTAYERDYQRHLTEMRKFLESPQWRELAKELYEFQNSAEFTIGWDLAVSPSTIPDDAPAWLFGEETEAEEYWGVWSDTGITTRCDDLPGAFVDLCVDEADAAAWAGANKSDIPGIYVEKCCVGKLDWNEIGQEDTFGPILGIAIFGPGDRLLKILRRSEL